MNPRFYKVPLKLLSARVLFIIVAYVFLIPLAFVRQWIGAVGYSVLTAIPYLALIYYDMRDVGYKDASPSSDYNTNWYNGFVLCLISQIPTFILLLLMLTPIDFGVLRNIYNVWNGPFLHFLGGPADGITLYLFIPIVLELLFAGVSYILGAKDIVLGPKKKK